MSEEPLTGIYTALAAVMEDCTVVAKRDRNTHQNFMFRGIDAVVNAVGPILRKHAVIVAPNVERVDYEEVETSGGKASTACRVLVTYTFYASDGSSLDARVAAEAWDTGDKAAPKAMSVAFRTALLQTLALPTDDKDPDSDTYTRERRAERTRKPDPADPWADQQPPKDKASDERLQKLHALFSRNRVADKPGYIAKVIGRQPSSYADLTPDECENVIAKLEEKPPVAPAEKPRGGQIQRGGPAPDCPEIVDGKPCDWRNPYHGAGDGSADRAAADHAAWHQLQEES